MVLSIWYFRVLGLAVLKGFWVVAYYGSTFYYVEVLEPSYYRYEAGTVFILIRS